MAAYKISKLHDNFIVKNATPEDLDLIIMDLMAIYPALAEYSLDTLRSVIGRKIFTQDKFISVERALK